ncbi:MAG TPA: universal stress protein [Polyangiaceae bacterium]|nr:universal stress protein [Polyangiaceae bacterium]
MPDRPTPPPAPRFAILAALDGSEHSVLVSEAAVALAARTPGAELHVVYVIEATSDGPFPLGAPRAGVRSALAVVEEAERYVEAHARAAAGRLGRIAHGHVLEGDPRRAIVQLGVDVGASLLVVGTRGLRGAKRLLLGSVAASLAQDAPFPVLVARAAPAELPPTLRPACARCLESQRRTGGEELWCPEHAGARPMARAFPPPLAEPPRGLAGARRRTTPLCGGLRAPYTSSAMSLLERVTDNLWTLARPLRFLGVETGARMNVARLADGSLFVHSPLALDAALRAEVDALGPVKAVVAPSLFHHLYVRSWQEAYPGALYACCPGLEKKRSDLRWGRVLGDEPEPAWEGEIEQSFFAARKLENEVVFFHRASGTMLCADALFNLSAHPDRATRAVAFLLGNRGPGATWLERLMIRDRPGARRQIDRMLAWKPERILLAHGPSIDAGGEQVLRDAYAWL